MLGLLSKKQPEIYPSEASQWVDTERCFGSRPTDKELSGLQNAGVLTILHLSPDGKEDEVDRVRAEQRGLNYHVIPFNRGRVDPVQANHALGVLNGRQNGPFYIYDEDGKMAGVMALLFKAIPNFWKLDRVEAEAEARGVDLNAFDGLHASLKTYMTRYVRGRR